MGKDTLITMTVTNTEVRLCRSINSHGAIYATFRSSGYSYNIVRAPVNWAFSIQALWRAQAYTPACVGPVQAKVSVRLTGARENPR